MINGKKIFQIAALCLLVIGVKAAASSGDATFDSKVEEIGRAHV